MQRECYAGCREPATTGGQSVTDFVRQFGNRDRRFGLIGLAKGPSRALAFGGHVNHAEIWQLALYRGATRDPAPHRSSRLKPAGHEYDLRVDWRPSPSRPTITPRSNRHSIPAPDGRTAVAILVKPVVVS